MLACNVSVALQCFNFIFIHSFIHSVRVTDNSTAATAVVEQSGSVTTTVVPATGADVGVNNVEEAEGQGQEKARVYTCRICRRVVFAEADLENHQTAQQGFCRRKVCLTPTTVFCNTFLALLTDLTRRHEFGIFSRFK